ncbi:MAG TPA: ATP-binding cassette domain-containing protein [Actinopolymorphaceae bacterium]
MADDDRRRGQARRAALRLLAQAFPGRTALLAGLAAASGTLPAIFAYLVGLLVGELPAAIEQPEDSSLTAILAAIGGVLLLQPAIGAAKNVVSTDLYWRHDDYLTSRVMRTTLRGTGLEMYEDPELAARTDRAVRIAQFGPGELVSGLAGKWTLRAEGFAATILVATVWPLAAVVAMVLWLAAGRFLRADFYRANPFWAEPLRRASYLKRLALMPDAAKEQRIFGLTDWLLDRFGREWSQVMTELWRSRRVGYRTMAVLAPTVVAVNIAVLVLAARAALAGDLDVAALTVLVQGVFGMVALASQDADIWIENGAVPVPDVLEHERLVTERLSATAPRSARRSADGLPAREIRFEGVRFAYPGRDPVYASLDLTIEAGHSLAIVGLNGAGKTTLVKLLAGLETPQAGRITIDGIDLADLDPLAWRRRLAVIFQDFVRFQLSARDNLAFGAIESLHSPDVDARVRAAAERAGATTVLDRLPSGLDTVLSRRYAGGVDLSGGQWQRVALARAMTAVSAGARVLVLDEPTAHLDVRAEADLYDRFLDITRGSTTILISHRFSTVRRADRIVVLDGGRIVEDGPHADLVAAGGTYARLFHTQARRYHPEDPPREDPSRLEVP